MSLVDKVREQIRSATRQINEEAQKIAEAFSGAPNSEEEIPTPAPPTAKSMREATGRVSALAAKLSKI